jgi:MFS family permease
LIFITVPERRSAVAAPTLTEQLQGVAMVFRSRLFWRLAPITMLAQASLLSLQGLWAGPWLRDVAHLDRTSVAMHLFVAAAGMLSGYLVMGILGERLQRRGINLASVAGGGIAAFLGVQLIICLGTTTAPMLLWALFSFCGTASILPFAILSQAFPSHLAGRLNTALNLLIFVAAFGAQYGIGAVIDLWSPVNSGGYTASAYQTAFGLLLGLQGLAFCWFLWPTRSLVTVRG